jgi:hypothetical protein
MVGLFPNVDVTNQANQRRRFRAGHNNDLHTRLHQTLERISTWFVKLPAQAGIALSWFFGNPLSRTLIQAQGKE